LTSAIRIGAAVGEEGHLKGRTRCFFGGDFSRDKRRETLLEENGPLGETEEI